MRTARFPFTVVVNGIIDTFKNECKQVSCGPYTTDRSSAPKGYNHPATKSVQQSALIIRQAHTPGNGLIFMVRRTKDEAEQTRNAILDAAEKVFYAHGVARTSLEQIAASANVTRGAVYWHFKDKIELCQAMFERVFLPQEDVLERLASGASAAPLNDLRKACLDSLALLAKDKRRQRVVTILMFRCEYVEQMEAAMKRRRECKDRMLRRCEKMFEQAYKRKELKSGWTPRLAATTLQALIGGLIMSGLEGRKVFDLRTAAPASLNAFFASISSKKLDSLP